MNVLVFSFLYREYKDQEFPLMCCLNFITLLSLILFLSFPISPSFSFFMSKSTGDGPHSSSEAAALHHSYCKFVWNFSLFQYFIGVLVTHHFFFFVHMQNVIRSPTPINDEMAHQLYVLQVLNFNLLEDRMMTKMDPQDQVWIPRKSGEIWTFHKK